MKIVGYETLMEQGHTISEALAKLDPSTRKSIENGWQPLGGVSICVLRRTAALPVYSVAQAIVKYE